MGFVRGTGVSRGSYSAGSDFVFTSVVWGSPVGHGTKFMSGKNLLGAKVLNANWAGSHNF